MLGLQADDALEPPLFRGASLWSLNCFSVWDAKVWGLCSLPSVLTSWQPSPVLILLWSWASDFVEVFIPFVPSSDAGGGVAVPRPHAVPGPQAGWGVVLRVQGGPPRVPAPAGGPLADRRAAARHGRRRRGRRRPPGWDSAVPRLHALRQPGLTPMASTQKVGRKHNFIALPHYLF